MDRQLRLHLPESPAAERPRQPTSAEKFAALSPEQQRLAAIVELERWNISSALHNVSSRFPELSDDQREKIITLLNEYQGLDPILLADRLEELGIQVGKSNLPLRTKLTFINIHKAWRALHPKEKVEVA